MKNTGTWNGDFAILLVLIMLLPLFMHFLMQVLRSFSDLNCETVSDFVTIQTIIEPEITIEPEVNFESIKRMALIQAAQGNNAARNWVTKHVFNEQNKAKSVNLLTSQKIIDDTLAALTAVKYKKADVKAVVYRLGAEKKYTDVGAMVLDCIKEL